MRWGTERVLGAGEFCFSSQARLIFSICLPQIMTNVPRPICASTGCASTRTAASNASASLALCWLPTGGTASVRRSPSSVSALFPACQPCSWGLVMCLKPRGAEKTKAVARRLLLCHQKLSLRAEWAQGKMFLYLLCFSTNRSFAPLSDAVKGAVKLCLELAAVISTASPASTARSTTVCVPPPEARQVRL